MRGGLRLEEKIGNGKRERKDGQQFLGIVNFWQWNLHYQFSN